MANPQPTDAHIRIAHEISEQLMVSHFTAKQRRILDLILRLSWGCGKKEAIIPHQGDFEVVGIFKSDIKGELDLLERDGVISRDGDTYHFNKDYDKWRVSRARGYSHAKVSDLLTINLNHRQQKLVNHQPSSEGKLVNHQPDSKQITNKTVSDLLSAPDTKLATPKEILKKDNKKESISIEETIEKFQEDIGTLSEASMLELRSCTRNFGTEMICSAIDEAVDDGEKTWKHVYSILRANDNRYLGGVKTH